MELSNKKFFALKLYSYSESEIIVISSNNNLSNEMFDKIVNDFFYETEKNTLNNFIKKFDTFLNGNHGGRQKKYNFISNFFDNLNNKNDYFLNNFKSFKKKYPEYELDIVDLQRVHVSLYFTEGKIGEFRNMVQKMINNQYQNHLVIDQDVINKIKDEVINIKKELIDLVVFK